MDSNGIKKFFEVFMDAGVVIIDVDLWRTANAYGLYVGLVLLFDFWRHYFERMTVY